MIVSEGSWNRYIDILAAINETAAKKFTAFLNTHETDTQTGRKAAIDYAAAIADKYGESAAAMACEMYDAIAAASGVSLPPAVPADPASYGEVAKTVNGMEKQGQSNEEIGNAIGRLVKRTGIDTTMKNAIRDGAEWAWIPSGDTCAFCLMLASNGWQNASKKALKNGHAEHIHSNCDCTYAIRFNGKPSYASYNPEKYYDMYENADGSNWKDKLNSMRRDQYAVNREKINAQKRAAYARATEKKRLQNDQTRGIIEKDREFALAAKEPGDATQPKSIGRDYQDFSQLVLSPEEKKDLAELNRLAEDTDNEYGLAVYQGGKTDIQTDNDHNNVIIGFPADAQHVEIYHSHTDDSVLSSEDIGQSATRLNVDKECVISINGDVWVIDYTEGIRPNQNELDEALKMCKNDAKEALSNDPAYGNWSYEERAYMLGRESMLRVARLFEWHIMGGHIDG